MFRQQMNAKARIKDELQKLIDDFEELGELCKNPNDLLLFGAKYQVCYTKALKIVGVLAADRLQEFKALYEASAKRKSLDAEAYSIQDFVRGLSPFMGNKLMFDTANAAQVRLHNQLQILGSLFSRIDGVLADVEGYLLSQLEDDELAASGQLVNVNRRAAGALAGVVLERHLQRVAANRQVKVAKKNPTIADLNDPLRSAGVYDVPTWRKIQHLADLRNLCSHQKEREPAADEVADLIAGVKSVVSNVS